MDTVLRSRRRVALLGALLGALALTAALGAPGAHAQGVGPLSLSAPAQVTIGQPATVTVVGGDPAAAYTITVSDAAGHELAVPGLHQGVDLTFPWAGGTYGECIPWDHCDMFTWAPGATATILVCATASPSLCVSAQTQVQRPASVALRTDGILGAQIGQTVEHLQQALGDRLWCYYDKVCSCPVAQALPMSFIYLWGTSDESRYLAGIELGRPSRTDGDLTVTLPSALQWGMTRAQVQAARPAGRWSRDRMRYLWADARSGLLARFGRQGKLNRLSVGTPGFVRSGGYGRCA